MATLKEVICSFGCGQMATFKLKSGKLCCSASWNSCPELKKKNSEGLKRNYASGDRSIAFLSEEAKQAMSWNKGLTKLDHPALKSMSEKLSLLRNEKPLINKHSSDAKYKISLARMAYLESGKNSKWYEVDGVKVQGSYEKRFADKLHSMGIKFSRKRIRYDLHRHYTPDFYIEALETYIEVKGWMSDRDSAKYAKFQEEHPEIHILAIVGEQALRSFEIGELEIKDLPLLKDVIKY